jgi:hypothetical protein
MLQTIFLPQADLFVICTSVDGISDRSLILVVCDMFDSFMILSGFFWHLQNLFSTLADKLEFRLGISGFIGVVRCILAANHDRYH